MSTIREVAKAAGVSTATISHVLNGRNDRVSEETRTRVMAAIRELKYRPPAMENQQRALLTRNIGVMASDLTKSPLLGVGHGYFLRVLDGILESAFFRGWTATITAERIWDDMGGTIRRSYDGRCDGLIFVGPALNDPLVESLQERGTPLVLVGTTAKLPDISSVDVDNDGIGFAAAEHLLILGHKTFAYIGRDELTCSALEREAGFRRCLVEADISLSHYQVYDRRDYKLSYKEIVDLIVESAPGTRPTGLMCWNDGTGYDLSAALIARGMSIPGDISIVGVDASKAEDPTLPQLTSFPQPLQAIGRRAANLLIDKLGEEGQPSEVVKFNSEISVQESTGPAPDKHKDFSSIDIVTNGGLHEPKQSIHAY